MPDVVFDFGDAPDSYGTTQLNNGASHTINANLLPRLGDLVDVDDDGQPIDQDDQVGADDEDGVLTGTFVDAGISRNLFVQPGTDLANIQAEDIVGFLNPLDPSGTTVNIEVAGEGVLNAWIDFDRNGVFDDDEQVITSEFVSGDTVEGSIVAFDITTPADAVSGSTWMRFRISDSAGLSQTGLARWRS